MKKELKRYILVENYKEIYRECDNFDEYRKLLDKIRKYNNNPKNKYLFGNVNYYVDRDAKIIVIINRFNKLMPKTNISSIDELTSQMDRNGLIDYIRLKLKTNSPIINIAYLNGGENIKIGLIPVLYKDDIKYLSKKYVFSCIKLYLANSDYNFILKLLTRFEKYNIVKNDIINIRIQINKIRYTNVDNSYILTMLSNLYDKLVAQRDSNGNIIKDSNNNNLNSRRVVRDFGFFIKEYKLNEKMTKIDEEEDEIDSDLQDEYALYSWDQDEGTYHKDFVVKYDKNMKLYKRV